MSTDKTLYRSLSRLKTSDSGGEKTNAVIPGEKVIVFPEPTSLLQVDFESNEPDKDLPTKKGERIYGTATINIDGVEARIPSGVRIQGASTSNNSQKNWNLFFYGSVERGDHHDGKRWVKIGNAPAARKLMFKTEQADATKIRDPLAFEFYRQIKETSPAVPRFAVFNAFYGKEGTPENTDFGARGFPFWYAGQFTVRGEHYGLGFLAFQKDWYNYNLDRDDPDSDRALARVDQATWKNAVEDGKLHKDVQLRNPRGDWSDKQKDALIDFLEFVKSDRFEEDFDDYLDKYNAIDMLIFMEFIHDHDGGNEVMLLTYDLKKWFLLPWDKDTTFGQDGSGGGRGIGRSPETNVFIKDGGYKTQLAKGPNKKMLWRRIWQAKEDDVRKRYADLRDKGVIDYGNMERIVHHLSALFPIRLVELELDSWDESDTNADEGSSGQILEWIHRRIKHMDKELDYDPEN